MRTPASPQVPVPQQRRRRRRVLLWLSLTVFGALVLLYAAVFSYLFAETELGPFAPLAVLLLLGLLLASVGPWLLVRYHQPLAARLAWTVRQLGAWLRATRLPARLAARYPRLASFLGTRFARTPTGLTLTLAVVAAGALLWTVLELLFEVVTGSPTVGIDHRLLNLVATVRTPTLDQAMYVVTFLGNAQTIAVLAGVAILVALLARRWREALLLVAALAASELFFSLLKLLVARPRPPLEEARLVQGGFSFPSGHSTVAATFYGTIAYLLIRGTQREGVRVLIGSLAALVVLAIGVSRIYLGVHYPSDVLAGWAAGALWLALMFAAEQLWSRNARALPAPRAPAALGLSAVALLALAGVYLSTVYRALPLPPPPTPALPALDVIAPTAVAVTVEGRLPHYTEGLTGHRQEPVSLVVVGTRAQLEGAFRLAGWTEAQPYGFGTLAGGVVAAITHRPDPAGPVTPSFLAEQPNALAFSLPVGATFAQRHHIRFWATRVRTTDGQPLWLATASFDRGFELAPTTFLPTHQIAPDVDTERAFVVASLEGTGRVMSSTTVQLVPPESGRNFDGDPFHTDGQAVVLSLG